MRHSSSTLDSVYESYAAFFRQLADCGLRHIVISPGARSAPLALLADAHKGFRTWVQQDERTAGFFALGLAKAGRAPAVLICTSGTAAANYAPAIAEAYNSGIPLLALTADRPPSYRGRGMEQSIFQKGIYGRHLRWFCEAPLIKPGSKRASKSRLGSLAKKAYFRAVESPAGPVHINCPFEEPLEPLYPLQEIEMPKTPAPQAVIKSDLAGHSEQNPHSFRDEAFRDEETLTFKNKGMFKNSSARNPAFFSSLKTRINAYRLLRLGKKYSKGLILAGCCDFLDEEQRAISNFSATSGWPILTDGSTRLRFGCNNAGIISTAALLFNAEFYSVHTPDVVVRLGSAPTSKIFRQAIDKNPPKKLIWLDPQKLRQDAGFSFTRRFTSPLTDLLNRASALLSKTDSAGAGCDNACTSGNKNASRDKNSISQTKRNPALSTDWLKLWQSAETSADEIRTAHLKISPAQNNGQAKKNHVNQKMSEPQVAYLLASATPSNSIIFLGNSLPVRDFDSYAPLSERELRPLTSRGASGIDGLIATALGAAAQNSDARNSDSENSSRQNPPPPTFLAIGDLSTLHDMNSLLCARRLKISINILLINNGGGAIFESLNYSQNLKERSAYPNSFEKLFLAPTGFIDFQFLGALPGVDICLIQNYIQLKEFISNPNPAPGAHIAEIPIDSKTSRQMRKEIQNHALQTLQISLKDPLSPGAKK